jgi:AraC family transcriptional regulator of adaptative response/methylated-DNA-[protein]-cysteine methyltransferase
MVRAMLARDAAYDGVFVTAVRTTGIFCRPTCPARKPLPENVEFYATTVAALAAGYRPCHRCKPLQNNERTPDWVRSLLKVVDDAPEEQWTDASLTQMGVDPVRVRRWFKQEFGTTFHSYLRARRMGLALERLASGTSIDDTASDLGYESVSGFRDAFRKTFGATPRTTPLNTLFSSRVETPLGPMIAMAEQQGLVLLEFADRPALPREIDELRTRYGYAVVPGRHAHLQHLEAELREYFAGSLRTFTVPLVTPGTPFERAAWQALREVAFGVTRTYGDLARQLEKPRAARAVGSANGRNRIAIVVPCHRICGANGELVGYGGGQARKQWLLDHERRIAGKHPQTDFWSPRQLEHAT